MWFKHISTFQLLRLSAPHLLKYNCWAAVTPSDHAHYASVCDQCNVTQHYFITCFLWQMGFQVLPSINNGVQRRLIIHSSRRREKLRVTARTKLRVFIKPEGLIIWILTYHTALWSGIRYVHPWNSLELRLFPPPVFYISVKHMVFMSQTGTRKKWA